MTNFLRKLSIAKRMALLLTLMISAVVLGGVLGFDKLNRANDSYRQLVTERSPGYTALARSQRHFQIAGKHLNHILLEAGDRAAVDRLWKMVEQEFANFETRTSQYEKGNKDERALAERNRTQHKDIERAAKKMHELVLAGNADAAKQVMRSEVDPAIDRLRDTLKDHVDNVLVAQAAFATERQRDFVRAEVMFGVALAICLLLAVVFGWLISRSITRPIQGAIDVAASIARGDLSVAVAQSNARDEAGQLMQALAGMREQLRDLVAKVQGSASQIHHASDEVASGNADLSQRTDQTSGHLQQTASSMDELAATVGSTAQSARTAADLAETASTVAGRGGDVVSQVVSTMDQISASSKKIGEIIGVIDGIAFQTNILALNAAVEAARAGEQGRGFAVVASEVRALAQRSAEAAREIKSLIGASVERVDEGGRLVHNAGDTMREIVESVERVRQIIGEITVAAEQQAAGIGQVNGAVAELDQMTQQNAALVEQSTAASTHLRDQAAGLRTAAAVFRLA
jgi:methyl-accepting chemotaxis protein